MVTVLNYEIPKFVHRKLINYILLFKFILNSHYNCFILFFDQKFNLQNLFLYDN